MVPEAFLETTLRIGPYTITLHFVSAAICAWIAASKGRSAFGWFVFGCFTSCLGVIVALCMSDLEPAPAPPPARRPAPPIPAAPREEPLVWYWVDAGRPAGPVTAAAMRSLRDTGAIDAATLVWRPGYSDWRRLAEASELR